MHRHTASSGSDGARLRLASFTEDEPMSEELSEDGYRTEPEAVFEGPAAWTDVDQEEVILLLSCDGAMLKFVWHPLQSMTVRWPCGAHQHCEGAQKWRPPAQTACIRMPPLCCTCLPYTGAHAEQCLSMAQLERVAVNVSRSAMPSSSDNSELANRLAMQAAALEADNMDPLGLGRIDTQVLGLVSASCRWHVVRRRCTDDAWLRWEHYEQACS